ncbi:hypothetical protein [Sporosarcina sp. JAI121]|uniref:hypothetical protein n=1 Tax=Sporosarcina sp. JAI121 TaxID=2723064 RepID=UPI0015CD28CE|nr:hypothetical protein [Sporosarcina sp. JAI121]NYF24608.1 hypothetical protein [Sporosarcina sp. JAI121]
MINKTLMWTALVGAFFTTAALKFLQLFNFISWSPVGWAKKWHLFEAEHFTIKWTLLFIALSLLFAIVYFAVSFTTSIPPSVTAILLGVIVVFTVEWTIGSPKTPVAALKSISIPYFAIMAIVFRFITGTAVYMKKISSESAK